MADNQLKVEYFGTNVGKIYLSDIDMRGQMGGSREGNYYGGQNEYIVWGETKILQLTGDVLYSQAKGILKYFSTLTSSDVFSLYHGAPLILTEGTYAYTDEIPLQDVPGDTGRFTDTYMAILALDNWGTGIAPGVAVTGSGFTGTGYTGGDTGYFLGNEM